MFRVVVSVKHDHLNTGTAGGTSFIYSVPGQGGRRVPVVQARGQGLGVQATAQEHDMNRQAEVVAEGPKSFHCHLEINGWWANKTINSMPVEEQAN